MLVMWNWEKLSKFFGVKLPTALQCYDIPHFLGIDLTLAVKLSHLKMLAIGPNIS